jgi:hypothetical protein
LLATLAIFVTLSAPLIAVVSRRAGHLTISDVGALDYFWYTNRRDLLKDGWAWNGVFGSARSSLVHPPRILSSSPLVLEFGEPIPGTYPIWYEPAYWWTGVHLRFDPGQQLASIRRSLRSLADIVASMSGLPIGALILLFLSRRTARPRNLSAARVALWWPVAACGVYSLLWIERRYLGGWLVLFWLGAFGYLVPRARLTAGRAVLAALTWVLLAITTGGVAVTAIQAAKLMATNPMSNEDVIVARLRSLGIGAGARLAVAGVDFRPYYAHIARARVVAQMEDVDAFWRMDRPGRQELQVRLARAGIAAIVARECPPWAVSDGWIEVPQSGARTFSILPLVARR